jgi:nucleoside-diphosphate-sugar epimerase
VADEAKEYQEAKRQAEAVFAQDKSFPVTLVRPPIVLGEDDYTGRLKFHIERTTKGQPIYFPNIDAKISFINSDCAANALLHICKQDNLGPLNIASKTPVRLADLMTQIAELVGKCPHLSDVPIDNHWSPFGIKDDWFMHIEKAEKAVIKTLDVDQWLPNLIKAIFDSSQIKRI